MVSHISHASRVHIRVGIERAKDQEGRFVSRWRDRGICTPRLQQGLSRNSLHVFTLLEWIRLERTERLTHGAMMILAPGTGSFFPSMEAGTCASHSSSSLESVEAREEYHEPAWLATLVVILRSKY